MTTLTVLIISLSPNTTPSAFLTALKSSDSKPLITARVVQWIITPTIADHLLSHNWDFTLVLSPSTTLPSSLFALTSHIFTIRLQESSDFLSTFPSINKLLLTPTTLPPLHSLSIPLIATSTQRVELTPSLLAFASSPLCPTGPISMLNFISFRPFASARSSYAAYIEAFKAGMGSKRGGAVKMIGETTEPGEWDEVVIAQYSSLEHFADMCADKEYQQANLRLRLPALRDTCILMMTEVDLEWGVEGGERWVDGSEGVI